MKKILNIFAVALLAVFISGCWVTDIFKDDIVKLPTKNISIETAAGTRIPLIVEVAGSSEERSSGLMNRGELAKGEGMLFVFEDSAPRKFWMKNTLIPLDLIFFNAKKEVVSIVKSMQPCPEETRFCPPYSSVGSAMYALEVADGFVEENGVTAKDKFTE